MTGRTLKRRIAAAGVAVVFAGAIPGLPEAQAAAHGRSRLQSPLSASNCSARARALAPCDGVRPGASITVKGGPGGCTMNFLFRGSDGRTYAGTGGHCVFDGADAGGTRTWRPGTGMKVFDGAGRRIGETAFWALETLGRFDFALIRLDRRVQADPEICQFGGPTRIYAGHETQPALVNFFSNQSHVGAVLPGRTLLAAFGFPDRHMVATVGIAAPGDSGAPVVLPDRRAVGLVSSSGVGWTDPPDFMAGNVLVMRLLPQVRVAERELRIDLRLLTPVAT